MRTLKQVCESIDPKLKERLLSFINSDAITDDIAHKMLYVTVGGKSLENFRKVLLLKGIGECSRSIEHIAQDYGQLIDMLDILNDPSRQITGDDVLNGKNIYQLLSGTGLNENMLKEIANLKMENRGGVNRGKYELLLILFIKNIIIANAGDVTFGSGSNVCHLEVKCDMARICNQKTPNFERAENFLRTLIGDIPYFKKKNLLSTQGNIMKTCGQIQESRPDLDIFDVLVRTLNAQYSDGDESAEEILGDMYKDIRSSVYKNDKDIDTKRFARLMMAIQLRGYLRNDVFDKLILIDGKSGNYKIIGTDEIESLDTFYNRHIKVTKIGGVVTGSYRDNFCQINYM